MNKKGNTCLVQVSYDYGKINIISVNDLIWRVKFGCCKNTSHEGG